MLRQHDLRRRQRGEDDVLHFERQLLHAADRVLNSRPHAVNDVEIRLEFLPQHPDRVEHAFLPIDVIMLDDRMEERVLRRDADFPRVDLDVFYVLLVDLVPVFRQRHQPAIVETLDVRSRHADVNASDHHVAFRFGIDHGFMHAFHRGLEIDDLPFPHTAGRRLPHAEDLDRAIGPALTDNDADFRRSNFEAHHEIAACHACS